MSCDKETIYPVGEFWEDKFGGEIWFKSVLEMCGYGNPTMEVRVKTPWGETEYIELSEDGFNKTYLSPTKIYTVELSVFCGMERTAVQANTCYEDRILKGRIRCQAYDSVSNKELNTFLQIDGISIVPTTPHITIELDQGPHTITFIFEGYEPAIDTVTVIAGETVDAYGSMVKLPPPVVPGFDINVNIPGLLPNSSLYVFEVSKIPLTDTWWDSPFGSGMRWDNISNGIFQARVLKENCDPAPASHSSLRQGQDYVIYVGTSAISLYPGTLVRNLTNETTAINITESYVDWVSSTLCSAFDISPAQCSNFIFTSVSDAAFLLEQWKIITEHKNLAGEETLPTALDYALIPVAILGMFSFGISEGKIAKEVGKRISSIIKIVKTGPIDLVDVVNNPKLNTFILRATPDEFDEFVRFLDEGSRINANNLIDTVDNLPLSNLELNALDRGANLVNKIDGSLIRSKSIEKISDVLSGFSNKLKNVFHGALDWTKENPKQAFGIGVLTIWFMVDNVPFYIYMYLKSKGMSPGDKSWRGKLTADVIDQYKFNVIEAEKIQAWDVFCENLLLWKNEVDSFEQFVTDNETTLRNEETYDIYIATIAVYREAIKIKQEVHTCWQVPLPESFEAEVTEITDGDTVKINYDGKEYDVRLLGINSPENKNYVYSCTDLKNPFLVRRLDTPGNECIDEQTWNVDEQFYNSTKEWLASKLPVHQNAIFYTDLTRQFDDYDRLLASPYYNEKYVCNESLRAGQSVIFFYDDNKQVNKADFLAAEKIARDANIGVWPFSEGTGWIKFISTPTAADVYLDGVNIGKTVSNVLLIETTLGTHSYEFRKVGYLGCKGDIYEVNSTHTENDPLERPCTLRLEEPPCPNPNASFVISPTSPDVNETITFDASASTAGGDESIKSYTWDFGDGNSDTGRVVAHTYVTHGSFVSKLTVRNDCRETDVATKTITIKEIIDTGNLTVKTYSAPGISLTGVTVYVDNKDKGNAPVTINGLPAGAHNIRLEKSGYQGCSYCENVGCIPGSSITPCDFQIIIVKDITKVLEVSMAKVFEFDISSIPEGATIIVDGTPVTTALNLIEQLLLKK